MTRKDYVLIADTIKVMAPETRVSAAHLFANRLGEADANFNRDRFLERALGKQGV